MLSSGLVSGLASIASQFDDCPHARGAVAFGRMVRESGGFISRKPFDPVLEAIAYQAEVADRFSFGSAINRHAQLAVSAGYRSADRR
ncbi:hypothetical protein LNAOJCKE_0939 [Methylorubrum aminovorans]|uniref:Uncharacterized protein n=1 Tax=Methylorubrum aminovorans TaxID=269069 RepID=A0ABQ4UAD2_9HYPH|nr:hypothetical protein [Methylorubrum aminovorans]GJE63741.1 hypothetical protein LNAOJCKE_0939 [Methylorubrum aminovorans]